MGDKAKEEESNAIPVHQASSRTWGDESGARLCQMIVESNSGLSQQIAEGKTDLMDILPDGDLSGPVDDLGITLPFLAVYYDRPDMLEYLWRRKVDLTKFCDPMEFGSPLFYALYLKKVRMILTLDLLGCSVKEPCDFLKQMPMTIAQRLDDKHVIDMITYCEGKEQRAVILVKKHFYRIKYRKKYLFKLKSIPLLQRAMRGMFGRKIGRALREARDKIIRRAKRKIVREEKEAQGVDLESDDEDTLEDPDLEIELGF